MECIPEWHSDPSCFRFHSKNIVRDFLRSNGMYCFVHLSPLIVSPRFWRLCFGALTKKRDGNEEEDDRMKLVKLFQKKLIAICRSSLFFVCFQHFSKLIQCYWRHYVLRGDPVWSTVGCVYMATLLAECFETPQRRIQYTLYTSTHIMRMMANAFMLKHGQRMNVKWLREWWSVIMFQLTFAIWSFMKQIKWNKQFCTKWSTTTMDMIL